MGFGDLKSSTGLQALNSYLQDKSYIEGYVPSQADAVVFGSLSGAPNESLPHALRWYNHIASYGAEKDSFPGDKKAAEKHIGPTTSTTDGGSKKSDDSDDDVDLFGSSSEEDEEEAERIKKERLEAYHAKKAKKPAVIAKSMIILDVKPWDDETDLAEVEKCVRSITHDGLLWGSSKLIPLAYGIKKLQIACVVEDAKVGTDFLEESITAFEELVQSVDVAAFNKL